MAGVFNTLSGQRRADNATLFAFDLIEFQGEDLRDMLLIDRKHNLERLLRRAAAPFVSTITSATMAGSLLITPAGSVSRALSQSALMHLIAADRLRPGSNPKIRPARPSDVRASKTGIESWWIETANHRLFM
jgi:hypothetical protein